MVSLMCNWFTDWGRAIREGLGETWLMVLIALFVGLTMFLLYSVFLSQLIKPRADRKFKIKWGQLFFAIVFILFTIWFCTLL